MNEELTLTVEEFRKMAPGRTWLIPIRFDDGPIPEWDLGGGRTLSDLNYVDLFGHSYTPQAGSLVSTIGRLMGSDRPSPAATLAAAEATGDDDRGHLLRRLTKEMLLEPSRRIELDDLISQEVRRISTAIADESRFPTATLEGSDVERITVLVETAERYWRLIEPFCYSLQVASRWGSPDQLEPWISGIRALVNAATKSHGGVVALLELRHIMPVVAITVAGIATIASHRWDNFRVLLAESTVKESSSGRGSVSILEATSPWEPFENSDLLASVVARTVLQSEGPAEALEHFTKNRVGRYHTPVDEWLLAIARPIFDEQLLDNEHFTDEFERTEVMLGVVAQDLANVQYGDDDKLSWRARSRWYGHSTWRTRHNDRTGVTDLADELKLLGSAWPPLVGGLFGASPERASHAIQLYAEHFNAIADRQF